VADNRIKSGRIGRVEFSKSGRTLYLDGKSFIALGMGEYMESESHESYGFSSPGRDGNDRKSTSRSVPIAVDEDLDEYPTSALARRPCRERCPGLGRNDLTEAREAERTLAFPRQVER
jgi:hypothetical protein